MRVNKTITGTASTPVNAATGLTAAGGMTGYGRLAPVWVRSIFIQMLVGSQSYGIVMDGIYGVQADGVSPRIPSALGATNGDLTAQLAPAGVNSPGGTYGDQYALDNQQASIDATKIWVDFARTGDQMVISYDVVESKL
jgi:hypothetical protein